MQPPAAQQACELNLDIHAPDAQEGKDIPPGTKATIGTVTLVNNDIDVPLSEMAIRLQDPNDIRSVEGRSDLDFTEVPLEDDLVRLDLGNPQLLDNVFLNVYAMAVEKKYVEDSSSNDVDTVPKKEGPQPPLHNSAGDPIDRRTMTENNAVRLWRGDDKTGPLSLPYRMRPGRRSEIVYLEGVKAGRYRVVLLQAPTGDPMATKAQENGDPHQRHDDPQIFLNPVPPCYDHVRLTVAVVDLFQRKKNGDRLREHVFDVLWGGRALIEARLWPPGGHYEFVERDSGNWLDEALRPGKEAVTSSGEAAGKEQNFFYVKGGFEPPRSPPPLARGQPVTGTSPAYSDRLRISYRVEPVKGAGARVELRRGEPFTVIAPARVEMTATELPAGFNGRNTGESDKTGDHFNFSITYRLLEQNGRRLYGPAESAVDDYLGQFGARLYAYEALGQVRGLSRLDGDVLSAVYPTPFPLKTAPRARAVEVTSEATFKDKFGMDISNAARNIIDNDIRLSENHQRTNGPITGSGSRFFEALQDVVCLIKNGTQGGDYDVRVARGQRLQGLAGRSERK